jgi:hypothetical protein
MPDQEPYVAGERKETEYDDIYVHIRVYGHWCENCDHLFDIGIKSPRTEGPNKELTRSSPVK